MKIGLLLEGGAMRGLYTAGVLDELMENNINIKRIEKAENKIQEMYDLGIQDCKNKIQDLKKYLLN